jgi:uncharacterized protein (TIGR00255 family)
MIKSMTGYGKATATLPVGTVTIEIRSLNSKFLDLSLRLPRQLQDKEYAIRNLVTAPLERGKVSVNIQIERITDEKAALINTTLFKSYHAELKSLCTELNIEQSQLLPAILSMPDVASAEKEAEEEGWWPALEQLLKEAIAAFDQFRAEEGQKTGEEMLLSCESIEKDLAQVPLYEGERIETLRTRIKAGLELFADQEKIDLNRFEQELVYYLEKLDVSEEKQRLNQHCAFFKDNMKQGAGGKKLGFIAQEMGREINTLGSKCNHVAIQKLVVNMKNELEKIKEQVLNVL